MNLFKKSIIGVFVFVALFSSIKVLADNSTTFSVGNGNCSWDGTVSLNKTTYFPGEQIIADGDTTSVYCNGEQGKSITADSSCIYSTGFASCGNTFDLFASNTLGNHNVLFAMQIDYTAGPSSGSASLPYTVVPLPTVNVTASPVTINSNSGGTSTINWTSTNATSCLSSTGQGGTGTIGNFNVNPTSNATYQVTCTGNGASVTNQATVYVINVNLTANPTEVVPGGTSYLNWTSTGLNSCSSSTGQGGTGTIGNFTTLPLNSTTNYSVTCTRNPQTIPASCSGTYITMAGQCEGTVGGAVPDTYEGYNCSGWNTYAVCPDGWINHGCHWNWNANPVSNSCSGLNQTACSSHSSCIWTPQVTISSATGTDSETVTVTTPTTTASLTFDPINPKDLVAAGSSAEIGKSYLKAYITNLPTNSTCSLKNITKNPNLALFSYTSSGIYFPFANQFASGPNTITLNCYRDSAPTVSIAESSLVVEGQSGTLTVENCTIPLNQNKCSSVPVNWTTVSPQTGINTTVAMNGTNTTLVGNGNQNGNLDIAGSTIGMVAGTSSKNVTFTTVNQVDPSTSNTIATRIIIVSCATESNWDGSKCAPIIVIRPDLIANVVSPTSATVNTPRNFFAIITNEGGANTNYEGVSTFTNLFQRATNLDDANQPIFDGTE